MINGTTVVAIVVALTVDDGPDEIIGVVAAVDSIVFDCNVAVVVGIVACPVVVCVVTVIPVGTVDAVAVAEVRIVVCTAIVVVTVVIELLATPTVDRPAIVVDIEDGTLFVESVDCVLDCTVSAINVKTIKY